MVCTGSGEGTAYDTRFPTDGAFYEGSAVNFGGIQDGLSNTVVFSESLLGNHRDTTGPEPEDYRRQIGDLKLRPTSAAPGLPSVENPELQALAAGAGEWNGSRGSGWIVGKTYTSMFCTYAPPNSGSPDLYAMGIGFFAARSNHPVGVNAALADGSVRFVSDTVDIDAWHALGSIAGGEVVTDY